MTARMRTKKPPHGWKILTHDFRPPIQGGNPLCDGTTWPVVLPIVDLDLSGAECSYGWNYTASIAVGFQIAGLWRTGRPNAVVLVAPSADSTTRGNKLRASGLTLLRPATLEEVRGGIYEFSAAFGPQREAMTEEQYLWWLALGRPKRDRIAVAQGLTAALAARGLSWAIKEYPVARDAWDAWAARDARDARDAWDAWAARDARAAWDAGAAWDAWAALSVQFTARSGRITHRPDLLTVGIRDAYNNGLAIAIPTGPNELGFAMEPPL